MSNKRIMKKRNLSKITYKELSCLNNNIIKYILPRLKEFKKLINRKDSYHGYPSDLNNMEEWNNILDKIIYSFQFAYDSENCKCSNEYLQSAENQDKYKEGMILFQEYLFDLWD